MKTSFKYGVSAIALLAAISLAQAQTSERQGGGASGSEHSKSGSAGGSTSSQAERGQGSMSSQHQGGDGGSGGQHQGTSAQERGEGGSATQHQGKSAQERGGGSSASGKEQRGQSAERNRDHEQGQDQERNRAENRADRDRERTGQAERGEESRGERSARTERENRGVHGEESRGRETELGGGTREGERVGRAGGERGRFASISREQKTRIHSILVRDSSIHRYHRSDVNFVVQVGRRIPNTIEFYDAPAQVVQIDPVFQSYKIVVLDDVILVIDPATREIVDVIRT